MEKEELQFAKFGVERATLLRALTSHVREPASQGVLGVEVAAAARAVRDSPARRKLGDKTRAALGRQLAAAERATALDMQAQAQAGWSQHLTNIATTRPVQAPTAAAPQQQKAAHVGRAP